MEDPRDPRRVTHSLPSLLRTSVAIIAQGWGDQSDAARLHDDPVLAIAANDRAGVGAAEDALASQATFSRLLDLLNREQSREAGLELREFSVFERHGARASCLAVAEPAGLSVVEQG